MQNNPNSNNQNSQFNNQINDSKKQLDKYVNENNQGSEITDITVLSLRPDIFIFGAETYIYKLIYYINEYILHKRIFKQPPR